MIMIISIIIILIIGIIIIIIIVLLLVVVIYSVVMIFIIVILSAWDNLRIDVYGFIELTKYFLKVYPDYFLSPLRISGSAVETLFGHASTHQEANWMQLIMGHAGQST